MLIILKLLYNSAVQWVVILGLLFAIGLFVPVPGPAWVPWVSGILVAIVVTYVLGVIADRLYVAYSRKHPLSAEEQEAIEIRVAAKMNRWR